MSTSSFRARELEALRMELRRELRMEANVFDEDDDVSDDNCDAVVGTPSRSHPARRTATEPSSRPSSRAAKSPAPHAFDDFQNVGSPRRGLGSAPIAELGAWPKSRAAKPKRLTSRYFHADDVVSSPSDSRAPPARSAALADRLVLATPESAARGRDRSSRLGRGRDDAGERERLRSPSLDRLAGTYRSLGALVSVLRTPSTRPNKNPSGAPSDGRRSRDTGHGETPVKPFRVEYDARTGRRVFASRLFLLNSRRERKSSSPGEATQSSSRWRTGDDARDSTSNIARGKPVRPRTESTGLSSERRDSRRDLKKTLLEKKTLPAVSEAARLVRRETRKKTIVEYDMDGRRVERTVWVAPASMRNKPAWSSRPGTSAGTSSRRVPKNKSSRPNTSSGASNRPSFDAGPGGLGVDHRVGRRDPSAVAETKPRTTRDQDRDRPATFPAPEFRRERPKEPSLSPSPSRSSPSPSAPSPSARSWPRASRSPSRSPSPSRSRRPHRRSENDESSRRPASRDDFRDSRDRRSRSVERTSGDIPEPSEHSTSPKERKERKEENQPPDAFVTALPPEPEPEEPDEEDGASIFPSKASTHARRTRVRTPSTSSRRAALFGFAGRDFESGTKTASEAGKEFSAEYRRAVAPSASMSPALPRGTHASNAWMRADMGTHDMRSPGMRGPYDASSARASSVTRANPSPVYSEHGYRSVDHQPYERQAGPDPTSFYPQQPHAYYPQHTYAYPQHTYAYPQQPYAYPQQPLDYLYPQYRPSHGYDVGLSPGGYDAWQQRPTHHAPFVAMSAPSAAASFQRWSAGKRY